MKSLTYVEIDVDYCTLEYGIPPCQAQLGYQNDVNVWRDNVIADGGSVSGPRRQLVSQLITGLQDDGVWEKLDGLWLFAAENQQSALRDLVAGRLATAVSAPAFNSDRGYTGDAVADYINTNLNPGSASASNWQLNNATYFGWNNTASNANGPLVGLLATGVIARIWPLWDGDNRIHFAVNGGNNSTGTAPVTVSRGLYLVSRTASNVMKLYINGAPVDTSTVASSGVPNDTFTALKENTIFSARQISCIGMGAGLHMGEQLLLYNRLRTYMTAVGVP